MKKRTFKVVLAELEHLYEINADDDAIIKLEEELRSMAWEASARIY